MVAPPLTQAIEVFTAAYQAAEVKAFELDGISYGVTECDVTRRGGRCSAYVDAAATLDGAPALVRSNFTVRVRTKHDGTVAVAMPDDRWRQVTKQQVVDAQGFQARRRGLS